MVRLWCLTNRQVARAFRLASSMAVGGNIRCRPGKSAFLSQRLVAQRCGAHLRGAFAKTAAEGPVEMRKIAEAGIIGDSADGAVSEALVAEHAAGPCKPVVEDELRKGEALALEQHLYVARRDAMLCGKARERQFVIVQAVEDFRFDGIQARRAGTAANPRPGRIWYRAEYECDEIMHVTDHEAAQFGCRQTQLLNELSVARQQLTRVGLVVRDSHHRDEPKTRSRQTPDHVESGGRPSLLFYASAAGLAL
jgi:hypothetical protein